MRPPPVPRKSAAWTSPSWTCAIGARRCTEGGAADIIVWRTPTARLLPRLLEGRRSGPVFLTARRARVELPTPDIDPGAGRARLSYRRAAECFAVATEALPGGPAGVFRAHLGGLPARYARVSPEALARWRAARDPAARKSAIR